MQRTPQRETKRVIRGGAKKKGANKEMKKLQCRPDPDSSVQEFTCYNDDDLFKLRDLWNIRHPDAAIDTDNTEAIWESLQTNFKNVCSNESCWLKQNFVNKRNRKELVGAFAPTAPKSWKKKRKRCNEK